MGKIRGKTVGQISITSTTSFSCRNIENTTRYIELTIYKGEGERR